MMKNPIVESDGHKRAANRLADKYVMISDRKVRSKRRFDDPDEHTIAVVSLRRSIGEALNYLPPSAGRKEAIAALANLVRLALAP